MRASLRPDTVPPPLAGRVELAGEPELLLVVHHDEAVRRRVEKVLSPLGRVEATGDAELALERFAARASVAVCEAGLPGSRGGLAFARAVRTRGEFPGTPVVLLSPLQEMPELEACGDALGVECLGEPFRDRELFCRVRSLAELSRQRRALKASEQTMRELFRASPDALALLELVRDERGRPKDAVYVDVNPAYERLFEAPREERIGRPFGSLPGGPEHLFLLQEAAANGMSLEREVWMPRIERSLRVSVFETSPGRFGISFTDLTALKRVELERKETLLESRAATDEAERVRRQLEAVFEAVQDGLMVMDRSGAMVLANRSLARILGFPDASALQSTLKEFDALFELSDLEGRVLTLERWPMSRVLRGETLSDVELNCRRRDTGQQWVFSYSGTPVYDEAGKRTMGLVVTRNITRRKAMEAELAATRDQLVDDLASMTRLHRIATRFMQDGDLPALLGEILDAAMAITSAQMGNVRLLDEASGQLRLTQCKGYEAPLLDYCRNCKEGPTCHVSLRQNTRVVVEDVATSDLFTQSPARDVVLAAGVRSVQSSPLTTRSGKVVGMLTTHGKGPLQLGERETKQLDLLARQTADIIERARWFEERAQWAARAEWQERLRHSEALHRSTVETMPLGLAIYGPDRRIVYVNPALVAFMHEPESHFVGRRIEDAWPGPHGTIHGAKVAEVLRTGERLTYELEIPALGERARSVRRMALAPVLDGDGTVQKVISLSQDITAEVELVTQLREDDRRKNDFIGVLSHELRNPLGAIHRSLELARRSPHGSEQEAKAMEIIGRQTGQLSRLVDDLLDVTRVTHGKISLVREPLDLREVVRHAVEDHAAGFERAGVRLGVRLPEVTVVVAGDRARLSQIVGNLLHNASKFTLKGGTTDIAVEADAHQKTATLRVADTGAGMDPALIESLFRPFSQARQTLARSQGGLGLGLALVRQLVELHGGVVKARSEGPGKGSEFLVTLPLADAAAVEVRRPAPTVESSGRRVLLVEDHADAATALRELLELDGHEVALAGDGLTGLALARQFRPDVVLCDIGLPGMDGLAVARSIRDDAALRGVVLVALTGYTSAADQARAREAGFEHLLAKPVSLDRLNRLLATVSPLPPAP